MDPHYGLGLRMTCLQTTPMNSSTNYPKMEYIYLIIDKNFTYE